MCTFLSDRQTHSRGAFLRRSASYER